MKIIAELKAELSHLAVAAKILMVITTASSIKLFAKVRHRTLYLKFTNWANLFVKIITVMVMLFTVIASAFIIITRVKAINEVKAIKIIIAIIAKWKASIRDRQLDID